MVCASSRPYALAGEPCSGRKPRADVVVLRSVSPGHAESKTALRAPASSIIANTGRVFEQLGTPSGRLSGPTMMKYRSNGPRVCRPLAMELFQTGRVESQPPRNV